MTIRGVLITDELRSAMILATLGVEHRIGRTLNASEIDMLILETVKQVARLVRPETMH